MKFEPFVGLGELSFGTSREHVRQSLTPEAYREFKRNEFAENSSDYYMSLGLFMEFNGNNELDAIEVAEDSNSAILYENEDLKKLEFTELRKMLDERSNEKEEEGDIGVTYHDLGISINRINEEDESVIILFFSENYW